MPACPSYAGHRFPAEITSHAVWLCFRFPLSLRMADELLAARGILVSTVGQTRMVLDVLVQSRRDKQAAKRLLRKLLKKQIRPPRVMITDKLTSYGAAKRETMPPIKRSKHEGLNSRAENSRQPTRRRGRQMEGFKSPGQAQRFVSAHGGISNLFPLRRHEVPAVQHRAARPGHAQPAYP